MNKTISILMVIVLPFIVGCKNQDFQSGYQWAQNNDIQSFDVCQKEFGTGDKEDGCNEYIKKNYTGYQKFKGKDCTEDCSGHIAGYEWAKKKDISTINSCNGNSISFKEGCESYVRENY